MPLPLRANSEMRDLPKLQSQSSGRFSTFCPLSLIFTMWNEAVAAISNRVGITFGSPGWMVEMGFCASTTYESERAFQYPHGRVPPVIGFQNLCITGEMDYFFTWIQEEFHTNFSFFELVDEPQSRTLTDLKNFAKICRSQPKVWRHLTITYIS